MTQAEQRKLDQEERVIAYLLTREGAMGTVGPYLKADYFDNEPIRAFYKVLKHLWDKTKELPTEREMVSRFRKHFLDQPPTWRDAISARIRQLYRVRCSSATYLECAEFIAQQQTYAMAKDIQEGAKPLAETLREVREKCDTLLPILTMEKDEIILPLADDYLDERLRLWESGEDPRQNVIPLGYPRIDECIRYGGMLRGELGIIMAVTNGGKTMCLTDMAVNFLERGYRVIYFSLDNLREEIEDRIYARMTGLSLDEEISPRVRNKRLRQWREKYPKFDVSKFILREMAKGDKTTVEALRHYIAKVEQKYGQVDVVIVDYGDLLVDLLFGAKEERHRLRSIFEDLRAMAKQHRILTLTASQGNKQSYKDEVVTLQNLSEAYSKSWPASLVLTLSQTPEEKAMTPSNMRISIVKNTKGKNNLTIPFLVKWDTATFVENSDLPTVDISSARALNRDDEEDEKKPRPQRQRNPDEPRIRRTRRGSVEEDVDEDLNLLEAA